MIYADIGQGIPPATELPIVGKPAQPIEGVWNILNTCWDTQPERRPSAAQVQEFVTSHWDNVTTALGKGFVVALD
jgi:hypothetical protein